MSKEIDRLATLLDKEMLQEIEEAKEKQPEEFELKDFKDKYPRHSEVTLRRLLYKWEDEGKITSRKSGVYKFYKYVKKRDS